MSYKIAGKLSSLAIGCLLLIGTSTYAQENEITDQDLRKYAILSEVIELMKKDLSAEVNGMIKKQDGMTGKRYKELAATKGDEAKLAEVNATEVEIKFLGLIDDLKKERTTAIKSINQELATKMIGNRGKTYKAIKSELSSNTDLKTRYDNIVASLQPEEASE